MAVSVVIPAFNAGPYIGDTIRSVLAQTRADWEIIVVDDGSTDDTAAIAQAFTADHRIRYVRQPENLWVLKARHRGTTLAVNTRVMLLDADDILHPEALEVLEAALDANPDAVCAYGNHIRVDRNGIPLTPPGGLKARLQRLKRPEPTPEGVIVAEFLERNYLATSGVAVARRDALLDSGCLETGARAAEDWACWALLATAGPYVHVDRIVLDYRIVPSGMSMSGSIRLDNVIKALDIVFNDARIRATVPDKLRRTLYAKRKAHALRYAASLCVNSDRLAAAFKPLLAAMRTVPLEAPTYAFSFLGVLLAHRLNRRPQAS